jgi:SAM-dependent methyltransferase
MADSLSIKSDKVLSIFKKLSKNDEFEIMFNNYKETNTLSIINFYRVLNYIKSNEKINKVNKTIELDIIYSASYEKNVSISYRISVTGLKKINEIISLVKNKSNSMIFSLLVSQFLEDEDIVLIEKRKNKDDIIDIDDYDIRIRKSAENIVDNPNILDKLKNLNYQDNQHILFRFKQRISMKYNSLSSLALDCTIIQCSDIINDINTKPKSYEVELDYCYKNDKDIDIINNITVEVKKILEETEYLISNKKKEDVIKKYKNLVFGGDLDKYNGLYCMHPISIDIKPLLDTIPNKYATSDKADGENTVLFINDDTYLIDCNLKVTKIELNLKNRKAVSNSIIEGELIKVGNKRIFMGYDCLYYKNKDVRIELCFEKRMSYLMDLLKEMGHNKFYEYKRYKDSYNLVNILNHYQSEIKNHYNVLNKELESNDITLFPKLFIYPLGGETSEIYAYAHLIYNNLTSNQDIKCPYQLDGIIFTGMTQKYTRDVREQKYPIYKYKPPLNNSIDFYIRFKKNKEDGNYMEIFDKSVEGLSGTYRVVELMVGDSVGGSEVPVPFMKEAENNEAYLAVENGYVKDIEGNIIQSDTVVEMTYNFDSKLPHKYRWIVLRTRWDKTESVRRFKKKYGNYKDVAMRTWATMKQAVTIEELKNMANPNNYITQKNLLEKKLENSNIIISTAQDRYYQKQSNLAKIMRQYANWVKSILIYTYCAPAMVNKEGKIVRKNVLDIGCGRGGDILKFYHARVRELVGVDPSYDDIYSSFDSAVRRYKDQKSKFPDFPNMKFLQADAGVPFNADAQKAKINNYSQESYDSINNIIKKDYFDVINSSFAIHYLFKDKTSVTNLIENFKNHLKKDGYILLTLFDPKLVMKKLDNKDSYISYYTDDEGKKNIFYQINKKFEGDIQDKVGNKIDVHMSWVSMEGIFLEEYLVTEKLMIDTLKQADCRLVDTDSLKNLYYLNNDYFTRVINYEENPKNKQFYEKIAEFFKELKGVDKESKDWIFLFRYYIFQKI